MDRLTRVSIVNEKVDKVNWKVDIMIFKVVTFNLKVDIVSKMHSEISAST